MRSFHAWRLMWAVLARPKIGIEVDVADPGHCVEAMAFSID